MDRKELNLNRDCDDGGGSGFIDRSKVRILLCENDAHSSNEVVTLLLNCSYQVIAVRSARQVIDALNAEGPDIDIILADLDLPMAKGMKMLKYITRDKDLRRIPVIMMSAQDEISIVVKCLRLGAADYLVKPLRTNELLNLWTHMWRRRRMLGLAEKNILNYEFDVVVSDPSDANTNSTTLFSDDTDDKSRRNANPETGVSNFHEDEEDTTAATSTAIERHVISSESPYDKDINGQQAVQFSPGPKRSELKIGESSAFFTYVKSSMMRNSIAVARTKANAASAHTQQSRVIEKYQAYYNKPEACETQAHENVEARESNSPGVDMPSSSGVPDSVSMERSCTPPAPPSEPSYNNNMNDFAKERFSNEAQHNKDSLLPAAQSAYPYCIPGMVNQMMITASGQVCQKNLHDMQNQVIMPQYMPSHLNGMSSFPYYPLGICLQPGSQMPQPHSWQSYGGSPSNEAKISKVDRREAALIKFRQKRKERCFDKKIRYVNRKKLAERRPRVRGQFVRKVNGVNVDLNGHPTSGDYDDDEEDDEALGSMDSTPEDNGSG